MGVDAFQASRQPTRRNQNVVEFVRNTIHYVSYDLSEQNPYVTVVISLPTMEETVDAALLAG